MAAIIKPSHVFLGEIRLNNKCLPNKDPAQYAKVSYIQIITINNNTTFEEKTATIPKGMAIQIAGINVKAIFVKDFSDFFRKSSNIKVVYNNINVSKIIILYISIE